MMAETVHQRNKPMSISEHIVTFANKPVQDWTSGTPLSNPGGTVYRISADYQERDKGIRWTDSFAEFLQDPLAHEITGLVVGIWGSEFDDTNSSTSEDVVQALVAAREKLPALTAIFMGDITYEENEISWINQTDVSPLLEAYSALEHFGVRGGTALILGRLQHRHLKSLTVETGGMNVSVVREVMRADLPELEHLELWLGTDGYGATFTLEDLAPLFAGKRYLGLRNSDMADAIAAEIAKAPILDRVRILDLSLGTLGDPGAEALINSPAVARLEKLDIHHHYCSDDMLIKLGRLGIAIDTDEQKDPHEYGDDEDSRYVMVGE
jgi:hypothetical protein